MIGILLVNLGTPQAATAPAVRRFLGEFLSDRRVVELPRWLWLPLLYLLILPLRSRRVARAYASIWLQQGSPLRVYTDALAAGLSESLRHPVVAAYRYGDAGIAAGLSQLAELNCDDIIVLPLYPQYSATTTATVFDGVADALRRQRRLPGLQLLRDYHQHPAYIAALADSVREHRQQSGAGEHLLLSFHGLPQRNVELGDPYQQHCESTATALATALGLADDEWSLSYQSRFGKAQWLEPSTVAMLAELGQRGVRQLDILCPGFAVDCLETLEEIACAGQAEFQAAGGSELRYIPALNASSGHVTALACLVEKWLPQKAAD